MGAISAHSVSLASSVSKRAGQGLVSERGQRSVSAGQRLLAQPLSEPSSDSSGLKHSETLLVIFDLFVEAGHSGREEDLVQRVMLESVAHAAQESDCRVLNCFRSRRWRRRLYESLTHLHQSGYISVSMQGYDLTERGRSRAQRYTLTDAERQCLLKLFNKPSDTTTTAQGTSLSAAT